MQVHAVPESERAYNSTGHRLPWAFVDSPSESSRRVPEEKGPFGKTRKRGLSRSKTATPARKEDQAKVDNTRVEDDIFARFKATEEKKASLRVRKAAGPAASLPVSASAPILGGDAGLGVSFTAAGAATTTTKEPTEVILYGYGGEVQWAAIDHFEKVSSGIIYEDYDRQPPTARYNAGLSLQKSATMRTLPRASLSKINTYVGGDHWIKVTFDSPEAAERACHYSPHIIQGFQVFAERWRGLPPPQGDIALRQDGRASLMDSPQTTSSRTLGLGSLNGASSATVSSATATATSAAPTVVRTHSEPFLPSTFPGDFDDRLTMPSSPPLSPPRQPSTTALAPQPKESKLRVRGAKPAVLLPASKALVPAKSRWRVAAASVPVVGWWFHSSGTGNDEVPRKEDGSFDEANASMYWQTLYMVDRCMGTDFCGLRAEEYDD